MKCRMWLCAALAAATAWLCVGDAGAGDTPKIKPTVTFAHTWDEAVQEAKELNLPLVVHSHGWY